MRKVLLFAIMAMFVTASQAQIVSSRSSRVTTTRTIGNYEGWNTVYLQWNPSTFSPKHGDAQSFTAFSVGYNHAFSVSQSIPLFVETGIGAQYSYWSKSEREKSYGIDVEYKINILSAKVPVSLMYKWDIPNSTVAIVPNAGLDFRFNIIGKLKGEASYKGETQSESISLFDDDEMKEKGALFGGEAWKRFQLGWHVGVNAIFAEKFLVGFSYGTDFMDIAEDVKINTASVTVGYCF